MKFKRVPLHPTTIREIKKGHFYIIKDSFTDKFPPKDLFFIGVNESNQEACLFLHDPHHPRIKGRVWSKIWNEKTFSFKENLKKRIIEAIQRRENTSFSSERENVFLCHSEFDEVPGVVILKLGNHLLIQFYSEFWTYYEDYIVDLLEKQFSTISSIWVQYRKVKSRVEGPQLKLSKEKEAASEFIVKEFGVNYKIKMGQSYDIGLYTDMASIRKKIIPYFKKSTSFLNLYSYTGAFSLLALKLGLKDVVSVDLASRSKGWFFENLELNKDLNKENQTFLKADVDSCIKKLQGRKFDLILSDPPSFSHHKKGHKKNRGQKNSESIEDFLNNIDSLLSQKGTLILFSNTHSLKREKIRERIKTFLKNKPKIKLKLISELFVGEDLGVKKGFSESDYLKGFIFSR